MITHEIRNINGVDMHYYVSDTPYMIRQVSNGAYYDEAYCLQEEQFTESLLPKGGGQDGASYQNPREWHNGDYVNHGLWYSAYQDEDSEPYLWECIKDGYPSSATDAEYFDVVGL